ncbi:MAG: sulfatase [Planctomycetaceae bacterium]|nr:sulfatase [Planctomycetaceae bacterium]
MPLFCRIFLTAFALFLPSTGLLAAEKPNIIWVVIEDMSAHFSSYGETTIQTPHIDRLAANGVKFTNAYVTAPVCSTCRSALVTGMYQTSIGAHHHRSGRGKMKIQLPAHVKLIPEYFQDAGYWTCNMGTPNGSPKLGKTDYNFEWDASAYNGSDWAQRKPGQPFFAQIQLHGGKLRSGKNWQKRVEEKLGSVTNPADVRLPPYYPDDEVIRDDWAAYLDSVRWTDHEVGELITRLEKEKILDKTFIFLITDHGISHARGKQFCYQEGMHIPLIVHGPGLKAGTIRNDVVVQIDMAASSMGFAGIEIPKYLQSKDLFADGYKPRDYVVSARDRCDETVDRIRGVTNGRFKYIRNFHHERPYLQPNAYKDAKQILIRLNELADAGKLNKAQMLQMAESRLKEELYDMQNDPWELKNLASDPYYSDMLDRMRGHLHEWIETTGDKGQQPEGEMFDSDMAVYLNTKKRRHPDRAAILQRNIDQMKAWEAEGK